MLRNLNPTISTTTSHPPLVEVQQLLADAVALLGACTPLPALYEDVLRIWARLPVRSERLRQADALLARITQMPGGLSRLADLLADPDAAHEVRLLAATLLAHSQFRIPHSAFHISKGSLYSAMACMTRPDPAGLFPALLARLTAFPDGLPAPPPETVPNPLLLLCFLRGLRDHTLSPEQFAACVLGGRVLSPRVAAGRPLRKLHRLLDYLGFSDDETVAGAYRQLVAELWPHAETRNWADWQWVTAPGGTATFSRALEALRAGECSIVRLHEVKYASLPPECILADLLAVLDPATAMLVCWVRPALAKYVAGWPWLEDALRWLGLSNTAAAAVAYASPLAAQPWFADGYPAMRQALRLLREIDIPPAPDDDWGGWRHRWIERALIPRYPRLCANLLLAQAASGEGAAELTLLAREGDIAALRALAFLPQPADEVIPLLFHALHTGGRPARSAAAAALAHLARRQGLPGLEELERQRMLSAAWEPGPLAGERVRVGWPAGSFRFRLSLLEGRVGLETLGPRGVVASPPGELRHSAGYRQARNAQRETQQQYRLFKEHLEQRMLDATPFSVREFRYLLANPIFAHLAERLLWQTADGATLLWAGPDCWQTLDGAGRSLADAPGYTLLPAHPALLSRAGSLAGWQLAAADRRLVQPFKQLFREVYLPGENGGTRCERFAGRRVEPRRAYAVLRAAGYAPGAGIARREWRGGVTACLCWAEGAAGRDLFGPHAKKDALTGAIWFTGGDGELPLHTVEPVVFSETLRAADLLTSRAALGDALLTSGETLALRATMLRQTARSFGLTNLIVKEDGHFALVLGAHATYRVNLASGAAYLEPEGRMITIPHHPPRWRPAEDGDATSIILATVLTLVRDQEIDDLTFLAQVRG